MKQLRKKATDFKFMSTSLKKSSRLDITWTCPLVTGSSNGYPKARKICRLAVEQSTRMDW